MATKVNIRIKGQPSDLFALIDDIDAEKVLCRSWRLNKDGYPIATMRIDGRGPAPQTLHQFIMGKIEGKQIDHINRDKLDCRRENLRHVTLAENLLNRAKQKNSAQPYKGIKKNKSTWAAMICVYGEMWRFTGFLSAEEAARFYDSLAYGIHGDVAGLNFPGDL